MSEHTWERDETGDVRMYWDAPDPHSPMRYCVVCKDYECVHCTPTDCDGPPPPLTLEQMRQYRDNAQANVDRWNAEIAAQENP